jgi:hypothetical protein
VVPGRAAAFVSVPGGGLLGLLLATQPWWTVPAMPPVSGNDATATLAGVLAGAAAAGGGLAVLLRSIGRRILGVLLALLGVGMVLTGWTAHTDPVQGVPFDTGAPASTGLQFAYAGAGLLVVIGGVLFALRAHRWPARPDRFARLNRAAAVRAEDDAGEVWKALDQGFDPTGVNPAGVDTPAPQDRGQSSGQKPYDREE